MCDTSAVTVTATPTGTTSLLTQAVTAASPRARRSVGWLRRAADRTWAVVGPAILPVAGLAAGSTAAFLAFGVAAGLAAVMVATFILDFQLRG
jgi:hypothetical protein